MPMAENFLYLKNTMEKGRFGFAKFKRGVML